MPLKVAANFQQNMCIISNFEITLMKYCTEPKEIQLISYCNNMAMTLSTNIFVLLILGNNIRDTHPTQSLIKAIISAVFSHQTTCSVYACISEKGFAYIKIIWENSPWINYFKLAVFAANLIISFSRFFFFLSLPALTFCLWDFVTLSVQKGCSKFQVMKVMYRS